MINDLLASDLTFKRAIFNCMDFEIGAAADHGCTLISLRLCVVTVRAVRRFRLSLCICLFVITTLMWKDTFGSVSTCSRLDLELGGETSLETGGELSLETGGETAEGGVAVFVLP